MFPTKVAKFLASGMLAASTEFLAFFALQAAAVRFIVVSQTVSFLSGFIVSFLLNRRWVFKSTGNSKSQLVKYGLLAGINLGLSNLVIWLLVDIVFVDAIVAKIAVMAMIAVWNYLLFSRLIFVDKK